MAEAQIGWKKLFILI